MTASEIEALGGYYGATPKPADFEAFWQARMAEADAVPLDYTVTQAQLGRLRLFGSVVYRHGRCAYLRQISAAAQR